MYKCFDMLDVVVRPCNEYETASFRSAYAIHHDECVVVLMVFYNLVSLAWTVILYGELQMIRGLLSTPRPVNCARRCSAMAKLRDCGGDYVAMKELANIHLFNCW